MEQTGRDLYILFSATPYRMGKLIRFVTREPYNHVSMALERDLRTLYAFARRYYNTPLYGGFVTEEPCRYRHNGVTARILLCRIPVTEDQWEHLQNRFSHMSSQAERYLYNHLSALMAPLHRKVRVRDAYTCAEFTVSVLQELGLDFSSNQFYSIGDIANKLAPYQIYTGDFPTASEEAGPFFDHQPLPRTCYLSIRDILALVWRKAAVF